MLTKLACCAFNLEFNILSYRGALVNVSGNLLLGGSVLKLLLLLLPLPLLPLLLLAAAAAAG